MFCTDGVVAADTDHYKSRRLKTDIWDRYSFAVKDLNSNDINLQFNVQITQILFLSTIF